MTATPDRSRRRSAVVAPGSPTQSLPSRPASPGTRAAWLLGTRTEAPRRPALHVTLSGLIVAAAALVYLDSLQGGLVLDNAAIIGADQRIRSTERIGEILTTNYWSGTSKSANFRPLTTLTYLVNYTVLGHGTRPAGYHVINTILHALVALLVVSLALRLGATRLLAYLSGLIFAVHPVATEAVANIVGRADLLAALFVLGGLVAHLRMRQGGALIRWWLVACSCYALAMASKESGVVFIALAVAIDLLFARGSGWRLGLRRLSRDYGGYLGVLVLMQVWRLAVVSQQHWLEVSYIDNPLVLASLGVREATVVKLLAIYASRCLFPWHLSADHSWRQIELVRSAGDLWFWGGVVVLLLTVVGGIAAWKRRRPLLTFALVLPAVALAPVSNAFLLIGTILAERLLYLPLVGVAVLAAAAVCGLASRCTRRGPSRAVGWAGVVGLLVAGVLGARTVARNRVWSDELVFWRQTHEESPRSLRAVNGYATALVDAAPERLAEAVAVLRGGLEIDPDDVRCRANLALYLTTRAETLVRQARGEEARVLLDEAERHARHAASIDALRAHAWFERHPGYPGGEAAAPIREERAYRALAGALMTRVRLRGVPDGEARQELQEAEAALRRAVLVRPDRVDPMLALAECRLLGGRFEAAIVAAIWALETSHGTDPRLPSLLDRAYRGAALDPGRFLIRRRGVADLVPAGQGGADPAVARHAQILITAYRMLVKILLAGDHVESARALALYAESRRRIPAARLEPLFAERVRPDQDRFWE